MMTGKTGPLVRRASLAARSMIGHALLAERGQHVFLRGEIIEEGSLADVGGFGDVLNGGFLIPALGEELQRGAKEAVAGFGAVALAAAAELGGGAERWK